MQNTPLLLGFFAIALSVASCDTLCTSGDLVVTNNSSETIFVYAENELLGSVNSNDQNSFNVNSGEQVIEVESGVVAPSLEVYNIDVNGCGETALEVD